MTDQMGAPETMTGPVIRVLAQYVKDLSFENPGAPESLRAGAAAPNIDLGIDVAARAAPNVPDAFEVSLRLAARANREGEAVFIAELDYCGLFQLSDLAAEQVEPVLLIDCPRLLFPFARRMLAEVIREGGFPPLLIDPVDFAVLFANQMQQREATPSTP